MAGKCSGARSAGQSTRRDTTPSSSSIASAARSGSLTARTTERPRSSSSRPPRLELPARAARLTGAADAPNSWPSVLPAALTDSHSEPGLLGNALVQPDEVAERHGKVDGLVGVERIDPQEVLEPRDDDREAERVEAAIDELEIIGERGELALLLGGNALELRLDRGPHGHASSLQWN